MLNWGPIKSWELFEELSVHLASEDLNLKNLDPYLKKGYKQHGIDIKGVDPGTGKLTCIQCKHIPLMSLQALKDVVEVFRKGPFYEKSDRFILTTTAELLGQRIDDYIMEVQLAFRVDGIEFLCWDRPKMEVRLKRHAHIVEKFFSIQAGSTFGWVSNFTLPANDPVQHYMERRVYNIEADQKDVFAAFHRQSNAKVVGDLLTPLGEETPRICILADGSEGKTSLLKQTAFQLDQQPSDLLPIRIELKNVGFHNIEEILNTHHPYWKSKPANSIILLLDGMDEVAGETFLDMLNFVQAFVRRYATIRVVLSCRTIFYSRYKVWESLPDFTFVKILPVSSDDIQSYLESKLGHQVTAFNSYAARNEVWPLLYKPFFLAYLTDLFLKPGAVMPDGRTATLEHCINHSLQVSKSRRITEGKLYAHKFEQYKTTLKKFAFGLQMARRNAFEEESMQKLFSQEELGLLEHSSLVVRSQDHWSFDLATFQEHIAGGVLATFEYADIRKLITVGRSLYKIKTKWVQTLASCLSLLDRESIKRGQLIELVEGDNIELLTLAEGTYFDPEERLSILIKVMERYKLNNTRPVFNEVGENDIGVFCKGLHRATEYLITTITGDATERIKIVAWKILRFSKPSAIYSDALLALALAEIKRATDGYYCQVIVLTLAELSIGDKNLIDELLLNHAFLNNHEYREGLYGLIQSLALVDDYYSFGLLGYDALYEYNRQITHSSSELSLESFLLATDNVGHLRALLKAISQKAWLSFYRYRSLTKRTFKEKLVEKLVTAYAQDPFIVFDVIGFFKFMARNHGVKYFDVITSFFVRTETEHLAVQSILASAEADLPYELFSVITEQSFDYIFYLHEEGRISTPMLRNIVGSFRDKESTATGIAFLDRAQDALDGHLYERVVQADGISYEQLEQIKRANDKAFIVDVTLFQQGLERFFSDHGKTSAELPELYIDHDARAHRHYSASNIVYDFLIERLRTNNKVYLKDCLLYLQNEAAFDDFRAYTLLHYPFGAEPVPEFKAILKAYYDKYLPTTNFTNVKIQGYSYNEEKQRTTILGDLFLKFGFATHHEYLLNFLWLDRKENAHNNNTITSAVLERLDAQSRRKLPGIITARIKAGINDHGVLENHLDLCRTERISTVVPLILALLKSHAIREYYYKEATEIYLELGGSMELLVPIFEGIHDFNHSYFWYLAEKLALQESQLVKKQLMRCLNSKGEALTARVDAAIRLAELGEGIGFSYLMDKIRKENESPITTQSGFKICNVDTDFALQELDDLCPLIYDSRKKNDLRTFYMVPGNLLIEILYQLGMKSEADLIKVDTFLRTKYEQLITADPDAKDLRWYAERNLEQFRKQGDEGYPLNEIKAFLQRFVSVDILS